MNDTERTQRDAERYRFLRKFLTTKDLDIITRRGERDAPDERDLIDREVDMQEAVVNRLKEWRT